METVSDLLECTICLQLAISPIYNCSTNGHIVCGMCIKNHAKCRICQVDLVPCAFAERIVKKNGFKVPCINAQFGCNELILTSEMMSHLEICDYRPFLCLLDGSRERRCQDQICNMNDFYQHLIQAHHVVDFGNEQQGAFSFLVWHPGLHSDGSNMLRCQLRGAKKFNNHIFLTFTYEMDSFFIWKVVIIGGNHEAKSYQYCVKLKSQYSQSKPGCGEFMWKGRVLSIRQYDEGNSFQRVKNVTTHLESCANIHLSSLFPLFYKVQMGSQIKYNFQTNIEISKEN